MWSALHRLRAGWFQRFLWTRSLAWGEDMHTASHSFINYYLTFEVGLSIDWSTFSFWLVVFNFFNSNSIQIWSFSVPHHAGRSLWIFTWTWISSLRLSGTSTHQERQQRPASSFYFQIVNWHHCFQMFPMRYPPVHVRQLMRWTVSWRTVWRFPMIYSYLFNWCINHWILCFFSDWMCDAETLWIREYILMLICMQVPFRIVEIGDNIFITQTSHGVEPLFRQGPSISWFERLHEVLCSGMAWARYYRTDGHEIHAHMWGSNY